MYFLTLFSLLLSVARGHGDGFSITASGPEVNIQFSEHFQEQESAPILNKRQECGAGIGSCPQGQCCSAGGQCGTGCSFCIGPDCQLAYGPACDGNTVPPGTSTLNIPRPKRGSVPYTAFYTCVNQGEIALTFDDGPYLYTQQVLDTLARYGVKATFFVTGNNLVKGRIDDPSKPWMQILKNMHDAGHHIASHTWTHQDLTQISGTFRQNQITYNEMAFRNIFGWFPSYIRPPYGLCMDNADCEGYLTGLGYHIVYYNVDTKDYMNDDPSLIGLSKDWFAGNISSTAAGHGYIPLSHDVHRNTAASLVSYMLDTLKARGYKAVTVGDCLGDPKENWYRDAGGVPASSSLTSNSASSSPSLASSSSSPLISATSTMTHPVAVAQTISSADVSISKTIVSSTHGTSTTTSSSDAYRNSVWSFGTMSLLLVSMYPFQMGSS